MSSPHSWFHDKNLTVSKRKKIVKGKWIVFLREISYGSFNRAGFTYAHRQFHAKNRTFSKWFSLIKKYFLEIQNRCLLFRIVHLDDPSRKMISFSWGISYGSLNMAGFTYAHRWFHAKNRTFSKWFLTYKKIKDAWYFGWFILKILEGKLFLFQGELATAPQTWQGFTNKHHWFITKIEHFQK